MLWISPQPVRISERLFDMLDDEDLRVALTAYLGVRTGGSSARAVCMRRLTSGRVMDRVRAVNILGFIGGGEARASLHEVVVNDGDEGVRVEALAGLSRWSGGQAAVFLRAIGDRSLDVRRRAALALAMRGTPAAGDPLREWLGARHANDVLEGLQEMRRLGVPADPYCQALTRIVLDGGIVEGEGALSLLAQGRCRSPELRRWALTLVHKQGPSPAEAGMKAVAARWLLASYGLSEQDAILALLRDRHAGVRAEAIAGVVAVGDDAIPFVSSCLAHPDSRVATSADRMALALGVSPPSDLMARRGALRDPHALASGALLVVAHREEPAATSAIVAALSSGDLSVRNRVCEGIRGVTRFPTEVEAALAKSVQREDEISAAAALAMAERELSEASIRILRAALASEDVALRVAAAHALGSKSHPHETWRVLSADLDRRPYGVLRAIARRGDRRQVEIARVTRYLLHDNTSVRVAAAEAFLWATSATPSPVFVTLADLIADPLGIPRVRSDAIDVVVRFSDRAGEQRELLASVGRAVQRSGEPELARKAAVLEESLRR
jgi:HEAT repeat protein